MNQEEYFDKPIYIEPKYGCLSFRFIKNLEETDIMAISQVFDYL